MFRWLVSAFLAVSTGCVSHEYKDLTRNVGDMPPYSLTVGDEVSITTKNAQNLKFEITEISEPTGFINSGLHRGYIYVF
jgi:hypothetical protein